MNSRFLSTVLIVACAALLFLCWQQWSEREGLRIALAGEKEKNAKLVYEVARSAATPPRSSPFAVWTVPDNKVPAADLAQRVRSAFPSDARLQVDPILPPGLSLRPLGQTHVLIEGHELVINDRAVDEADLKQFPPGEIERLEVLPPATDPSGKPVPVINVILKKDVPTPH